MRGLRAWFGVPVVTGALSGLLLLSGCRVESTGKGENEKFRVATPFGGLQVKTNESVVESGIGVPIYPGATLVKKDKDDKDDGAADIDLTLGSLRLRVKALNYRTEDTPDKVQAFYGKELRRFGTVIQCRDDSPVGEPTRTPEGLTCDKEKGHHVTTSIGKIGRSIELKAGSPQHQHIVGIDAEGHGTKFALVLLDLPRRLVSDSGSDDDE